MLLYNSIWGVGSLSQVFQAKKMEFDSSVLSPPPPSLSIGVGILFLFLRCTCAAECTCAVLQPTCTLSLHSDVVFHYSLWNVLEKFATCRSKEQGRDSDQLIVQSSESCFSHLSDPVCLFGWVAHSPGIQISGKWNKFHSGSNTCQYYLVIIWFLYRSNLYPDLQVSKGKNCCRAVCCWTFAYARFFGWAGPSAKKFDIFKPLKNPLPGPSPYRK